MEWQNAILKWKIKNVVFLKSQKEVSLCSENLLFCLKGFRVNASEFSYNSFKMLLSLLGVAKYKLTLQLSSACVLSFLQTYSFFFFPCKNNIFTISNWVIEHFLLSTKILHDGWLALSDPKGMKVMVFLEPDPINIHFLNIWCPLSYCTLQLNAISKVTVHGSKNYRSFYYIDIQ